MKDVVTTVLALLTVGLYYVKVNEVSLPLIPSGYRIPIVILTVVGLLMCANSGYDPAAAKSLFTTLMTVIGTAAFLIIIYGLITGAKVAFTVLTAIILVMWVASTLKHLLIK